MAKIINLGGMAAALSQRLYQSPGNTIANVSPTQWPSAMQPIAPVGPPGSVPLAFPMWTGQNLTYTPRPDEELTAADLRFLAKYPLARICIENAKDQLCKLAWRVQLRQKPGETKAEVAARRKAQSAGDSMITKLSELFEMPDGEHSWPDWLRPILEDMMTVDAASVLIERTFNGTPVAFRWIPGDNICRYVDDSGVTPKPPSVAYAQLWNGTPRVNLTTDQLLYRPRNIVPRNTISSYLYGYSPVEQVAQEIQIGWARLTFVKNYYENGSMPNMIQVVPPNVTVDKMKESMDWINSELAGNLINRRQWRLVQGFARDGDKDQILFPKEPILADLFDDLHIRKLCFAFGASPQRLMRMMNRASAQVSQEAAEQEAILPWADWFVRSIINPLIWLMSGNRNYEMVVDMDHESDAVRRGKIEMAEIAGGRSTINEIKIKNGEDPSGDPAADQLAVTTPQGRVPIGKTLEEIKADVAPPLEPRTSAEPKPAPGTKPVPRDGGKASKDFGAIRVMGGD